ncbi:hypothetical protein KC872_02335, partial [Candidatus Kaiserbacteria bacterium]|nr:hypothetical protein [Candidatus Kaiserbacteria bacterium]
MDWFSKSILGQWFVTGVLLGIGFVFPILWVLGIVGGAYFIYLLKQTQTLKTRYLGAWLAWTIKTAFASVWFWSTYPIDWLPVEIGKVQLLLIGGYWLIASLCLGAGGIVVVLAWQYGQNLVKSKYFFWGLSIPSAWVMGEVVGSIVFSIVALGPGGTINSSLSFGYSGYLLAEHQWFMLVAKMAGVYSLSFGFILLAISLLKLTKFITQQYHYVLLVFIILLSVSANLPILNKTVEVAEGYKVVTIDTNFPAHILRDKGGAAMMSDELSEAMTAALTEEPDYILLPEDARFFAQRSNPAAVKAFFQFQYHNPTAVIVDSGRVDTGDNTFLQTFIYTGGKNKIEQVHKRYLVPQGEFLSYFLSGLLRLIGYGDVIDQVSRGESYQVGPNTDQSSLSENVPGILFCFESVAPTGVWTLLKERPNLPFVAHPISHGWFHESKILWHELDTMLKIQAVWNNKYIVSAGSHAEGKVY